MKRYVYDNSFLDYIISCFEPVKFCYFYVLSSVLEYLELYCERMYTNNVVVLPDII